MDLFGHHHERWSAVAPFWNAAIAIGLLIGLLAPLIVQPG